MADKTNPGATDSTTVDAGVSGRQIVFRRARLLSGSVFLCQVLDLLLSHSPLFLENTVPSAAVSCCNLPALSVDVQSFHVMLADIFIAQLGSGKRSYTRE